METPRPKIGTCALVFRDGKILLNLRKGDGLTEGMYGTPGGHVEHLECLTDSVIREIKEEADIEVENISFVGVVNVRDFAPAHYVMLVFRADWKSGEPRVCEPDRNDGWAWFALSDLPQPLTPATEKGIAAFRQGRAYFE